jgi:hypothetical protein
MWASTPRTQLAQIKRFDFGNTEMVLRGEART